MRDEIAVHFVPVTQTDLPMLRRWLEEPHVREWWGEPEQELGFIRDMIEGRDSTRPFIIKLGGVPVGYIQYWFIGHHQNEDWIKKNPWLTELPSDAVGVDLSIGEPAWLSQGIGSKALAAFVCMLRSEGFRTIITDPDRENARAVRAYMKAGFKPIPDLEGRTGDILIMQYDPNIKETTI
ncbi:GNAT family N-acetyltransferase [Chelativorans sp. AA-79]|uniref:GNAT family N-acetyltransferase n=1 Tax=Chelativorans sp. AA-79 TaxID=3028735 RepID=UPI0023FA34CE|nr:GNAT family N-acetyltransferase [Chelativorans sp. AA-79]WEX09598.1 GNAT family N-acetyltransferase [Chelativorans sp. AA-79]